jgi:hypothetical protein
VLGGLQIGASCAVLSCSFRVGLPTKISASARSLRVEFQARSTGEVFTRSVHSIRVMHKAFNLLRSDVNGDFGWTLRGSSPNDIRRPVFAHHKRRPSQLEPLGSSPGVVGVFKEITGTRFPRTRRAEVKGRKSARVCGSLDLRTSRSRTYPDGIPISLL